MKNGLDEQYIDLLKYILENGVEKDTRNGKTLSVFGRQIRYKFKDGKFPLLTTKKMYWKGIVTELLWFLRGDTNIKYLVDNDCHIWDGDAHKRYLNEWQPEEREDEGPMAWMDNELVNERPLPKDMFIECIKKDDEFANRWGDLGPVYGKQWRLWFHHFPKTYPEVSQDEKYIGVKTIDQISNLINDLKTNPDSRRLMVNAWNVGELDQMTLPPCHYGFQVYTRELSDIERYTIARQYALCPKYSNIGLENCTEEEHYDKYNVPKRAISLMWNQRSVDTFLGLPFNIASYGLLLEIIAKEVNMVPDELIGTLGDVHLYKNHIEQAKEQLTREPMKLPSVCLDYRDGEYNKDLTDLTPDDIVLFDYNSHDRIKAPLSN